MTNQTFFFPIFIYLVFTFLFFLFYFIRKCGSAKKEILGKNHFDEIHPCNFSGRGQLCGFYFYFIFYHQQNWRRRQILSWSLQHSDRLGEPGFALWPTWLFWVLLLCPALSVTLSYMSYYIFHGLKEKSISFQCKMYFTTFFSILLHMRNSAYLNLSLKIEEWIIKSLSNSDFEYYQILISLVLLVYLVLNKCITTVSLGFCSRLGR